MRNRISASPKVAGRLSQDTRRAVGPSAPRCRIAFIFIGRTGKPLRSIRNALETACREAKLRDVTPHTFRHTFASRLAMANVDLRTIQELGGWKTLRLVERYAHLSPSHKAEAVERIVAPSPITSPNAADCDVGTKAVSS